MPGGNRLGDAGVTGELVYYLHMKAVVFDFDGTVADSLLGVLAVYERAHTRNVPFTTEDVQGFRNKSLYTIARELKIPIYKLVWLLLFGRKAFRDHIDKVQVYDGLGDLIKRLYKKEVRVYVLSLNRPDSIHDFLRMHKLDVYVRAVYGKAFVLNKAPKLRMMMQQEGLQRTEVCYVGDQTIDVDSARRAGVMSIAVSWGYAAREKLARHNPDHIVDDAAELAKVLRV